MVGVGVGRFRHLCYSPCWCCDRCSSRGRWLLSLSQALSLTTTVSGMQNFHVPNPVVVLTLVLVPEHADLRLIPTDARGGGIPPGGRACGIRRTRCARTCGEVRRSRGARASGLHASGQHACAILI